MGLVSTNWASGRRPREPAGGCRHQGKDVVKAQASCLTRQRSFCFVRRILSAAQLFISLAYVEHLNFFRLHHSRVGLVSPFSKHLDQVYDLFIVFFVDFLDPCHRPFIDSSHLFTPFGSLRNSHLRLLLTSILTWM